LKKEVIYIAEDLFLTQLFKMEGAAAMFQNDMRYTQWINGTVNGQKFSVLNEGKSKYPHGDFWTHATCTSGKLPFSWKVLCHVLQYGVPMFGRYPNGLTHFTRESFPEGFTIDRTVRFEGDGTMTSHHTYEIEANHITTRVTLTMDGFDPNGAVMQDGLVDILTTESHIYPSGDNAVRQLCTIGFEKTDGQILISWFDSKMTFNGSRKITLPNPHFVTTTNRQMKDDSCKDDHIVQREIAIARPAPNIVSAV